VKRRWRERNAEAVVRFRSLDNNAVVQTRVGQSDGPGGGGIGAQGGRDGYAAQGEAHVVQVVKECTPEPKEIVGGPHGKERERRHSRWSGSGTRKREQAPDRRAQTRSRSPEPRGAGLERSSRRCLFDGSPRSRPPPPLIEKCFLDDVSDILLPCSCYQTTMRSGRECASRQCLPTGNKGREEREGTGSPI